MIEAKIPVNEAERMAALLSYDILDTDPETCYDDLTRIASAICGTPIALISLVDSDRQWFKSRVGLEATETPRRVAYCSHAILEPDELLVVPDAFEDERFCDNPLATGEPHVRFYAGAPLVVPSGEALGTLCVIDHEPRGLTREQQEQLRMLARQVVSQLELRRSYAEMRGLAQQLYASNQELEQFTSIAAHDLQEPIRKLVSFSGLLRSDLPDELPDRAAQDLTYIEDAARRMQRLIRDLLDLSRAGTSKLATEEISPRDCVDDALRALSLRVEETGTSVEIDDLPPVRGDRTLLNQLFQNLISNAIKFVREGRPVVHVTYAFDDGRQVFGIRDNGIGMQPEHADTIFAPFKRLHDRSEFEGTGIGLSIARKAVERHGGEIWVESEPGHGSHFKFTLPVT